MFKSILQMIFPLLIVFILMSSGVAAATESVIAHRVETGGHQQVNGIDIYIGVVPDQIAGELRQLFPTSVQGN